MTSFVGLLRLEKVLIPDDLQTARPDGSAPVTPRIDCARFGKDKWDEISAAGALDTPLK
jgi:hypothetical protein